MTSNLALDYRTVVLLITLLCASGRVSSAQNDRASAPKPGSNQKVHQVAAGESSSKSLEELKADGARSSSYRKRAVPAAIDDPTPNLAAFREDVEPVLQESCTQCHGAEIQEGHLRLDTLDPDLLHGTDVDWWLEVLSVVGNGEMPPPDEIELPDDDRSKIIEWLASEIQVASAVRRSEQGHSSFRRMARYEFNFALQDLLGLPYDFAKDLPPDPVSAESFQNSSEILQMSAVQFRAYREAARNALKLATVKGERPELIYWGIDMKSASADAWAKQEKQLEQIKREHQDDPEKLKQALERLAAKFRARPNATYYRNLTTGRTTRVSWSYGGAKYAWTPMAVRPEVPSVSDHVAVIPAKRHLILELGDRVPERGTLRVRVRAARTSVEDDHVPSLQLEFGWQASNDSAASVRISERDMPIQAAPDEPVFYQWDIPLNEIYPRNSVRKTSKMGDLPSPSEFVKLVNSSVSHGDVQLDYVEITAPVYDQWPPESHTRIFIDSPQKADENMYARDILTDFMSRAWRRKVSAFEVDQKLSLFRKIRPASGDFQEAIIDVLATVLSSPKFLYLVPRGSGSPSVENQGDAGEQSQSAGLRDDELATRLSMFLWCSTPDQELRDLAARGELGNTAVLRQQVERMLADPRSRRFSNQFVRQWLGMQLLDYLDVDRQAYPEFDQPLKEAMQREPIAFFDEVLQSNASVLDFLHADYVIVNERLARHYGLSEIYGNHFRRVQLGPQSRRGGLLTQAGLLAMNSDGKDSHPLKRGIWMLERLLDDPPPPPPPAVPEIDLADPEIAKLTLKERIEDHRNDAACMSCHAKIDPWGIAFENFDAVGNWRTRVGGKPVDASSQLFNGQKLDGMDGLKGFLLQHRQDQFVRAVVHKMATFAVGRPLRFRDRSSIDQITSELRKQGDGLATMVKLIVTSELFHK